MIFIVVMILILKRAWFPFLKVWNRNIMEKGNIVIGTECSLAPSSGWIGKTLFKD